MSNERVWSSGWLPKIHEPSRIARSLNGIGGRTCSSPHTMHACMQVHLHIPSANRFSLPLSVPLCSTFRFTEWSRCAVLLVHHSVGNPSARVLEPPEV